MLVEHPTGHPPLPCNGYPARCRLVSVIRRVNRPDAGFTSIRNAFLRDASLSFHARGLGAWLLSHVEGWECNTVSIAKQAGVGRDQVRRALRELEAARYLRRTRLRTESGALGDSVYEIQCEPFPEEEKPRSDQRLGNQALAGQALARPQHKKNIPQKTNPEEQPSGGDGASPPLAEQAVDNAREDAVPQEALFDVPAPAKPARPPGAGDVVAAYVVAYREKHGGREPLKADRGRVGRDAGQMLRDGQATVEELLVAATTLGGTEWANLGQQVKFGREGDGGRGGPRPGRAPGMAPALPNDAPVWDELTETHRFGGFDAALEAQFMQRVTDV